MGRTVGKDWPNNGCGMQKGGDCDALCASDAVKADNWGKELIMKYSTGLKTKGVFHTDANGREMMKRVYNERGASYPKLEVHEPIAANYYPINSMISIDDGTSELAVIIDTSVGGSSIHDGEVELMVSSKAICRCFVNSGSILTDCLCLQLHRRVMVDDSRGVQEPLNETMCGCNDIGATPGQMGAHGHEADGGCECAGLTMRGKHYLVFDTVSKANAQRRALSESLNFPPTLAFSHSELKPAVPTASALAEALPANVKLLTLTENYKEINGGKVLLRLAHLYSVGEHPTLSQPVIVSLADLFNVAGHHKITGKFTSNPPLRVVSRPFSERLLVFPAAEETSLTANQLGKCPSQSSR